MTKDERVRERGTDAGEGGCREDCFVLKLRVTTFDVPQGIYLTLRPTLLTILHDS